MKVVVQRSDKATLKVDGKKYSEIPNGLMILVGFTEGDSIEEIKSTCACGRKTSINARIDGQGNIVTDGNQVEIGGDDKYVSLCRHCWRNRRIESTSRNAIKFDGE